MCLLVPKGEALQVINFKYSCIKKGTEVEDVLDIKKIHSKYKILIKLRSSWQSKV